MAVYSIHKQTKIKKSKETRKKQKNKILFDRAQAFGSAISDIAEAMVQCVIGQVIVSSFVWKLIKVF